MSPAKPISSHRATLIKTAKIFLKKRNITVTCLQRLPVFLNIRIVARLRTSSARSDSVEVGLFVTIAYWYILRYKANHVFHDLKLMSSAEEHTKSSSLHRDETK